MDAATLGFGATFASLATREGLIALDKRFLEQVAAQDPALHESLLAARAAPDSLEDKAESHLITSLGPILDDFVAELFGIQDALDEVVAQTKHLDPVHSCKRLFVQRQAVKNLPIRPASMALRCARSLKQMMGERLTEVSFADPCRRLGAQRAQGVRWTWPCAMPPGRRLRRRAAPSTRAARCSGCRTRSTSSSSGADRHHRAQWRDDAVPARA